MGMETVFGIRTNYWAQSVLFVDKTDGRQVEVEIDGTMEPYKGIDAEGYYNWGFQFRFGKIIKRKK